MIKTLIFALSLLGLAACSAQPPFTTPNASLTNTYWKLVELEHQPAALGAEGKELSMVLHTENNRINGFSGCNRFMGTYALSGHTLKISTLASTRKMCIEHPAQEDRFLQILSQSQHFEIQGNRLVLKNEIGSPLLSFIAVDLQ